MIHELKTINPYFKDVVSGVKQFEVRKYDRPYRVGDVLHLHEYDLKNESYSGDSIKVKITYFLFGGNFGIDPGHVVLGIELVDL